MEMDIMININETPASIECELADAENALQHDDGRRWPPPPVPSEDKSKWAQDNSSAVDPADEASIKAYAFATLPMLPVYRAGQFPFKRGDEIASMLRSLPENSWIPLHGGLLSQSPAYLRTKRQHPEIELHGDHEYYGVTIFIKRLEGITFVNWRSNGNSEWDRRPMSYAQRLAEARLLKCHSIVCHALQEVLDSAYEISKRFAEFKALGKAELVESAICEQYAARVASPLPRLHQSMVRFNRLAKRLYEPEELRLPMVSTSLLNRRGFYLDYPCTYPVMIPRYLFLRLLADPEIKLRSLREHLSGHNYGHLSRTAQLVAAFCAKYDGQ